MSDCFFAINITFFKRIVYLCITMAELWAVTDV